MIDLIPLPSDPLDMEGSSSDGKAGRGSADRTTTVLARLDVEIARSRRQLEFLRAVASQRSGQSAPGQSAPVLPGAPSPRGEPRIEVLVVEDDRDLAEALSEVLSERGFAVACAHTSAAAVALLGAGAEPAAIVLDLGLPGTSGAAVLEALRGREPGRAPPQVVVFTAASREEIVASGIDQSLVVRKPDLGALLLRLAEGVQTRSAE